MSCMIPGLVARFSKSRCRKFKFVFESSDAHVAHAPLSPKKNRDAASLVPPNARDAARREGSKREPCRVTHALVLCVHTYYVCRSRDLWEYHRSRRRRRSRRCKHTCIRTYLPIPTTSGLAFSHRQERTRWIKVLTTATTTTTTTTTTSQRRRRLVIIVLRRCMPTIRCRRRGRRSQRVAAMRRRGLLPRPVPVLGMTTTTTTWGPCLRL